MPSRRMTVPLVVLAVVLAPLVVAAIYVEDWSRDLTTNVAATSADHPDERQRPVVLRGDVRHVQTLVEQFIAMRPAWRLADDERGAPPPALAKPLAEGATTLHLVRTTPLMRYRDDVWVAIEPVGDHQVRIGAESRSRLGKGDLGQNPRNLRELLGYLRDSGSAAGAGR